jgi:glycosyltransferase involved in cell wall biosynthesis
MKGRIFSFRLNPRMSLERHLSSTPMARSVALFVRVRSVGIFARRKNIARLLEAFARLPESLLKTMTLALVGQKGYGSDEILPGLARYRSKIKSY